MCCDRALALGLLKPIGNNVVDTNVIHLGPIYG